MVVSHQLAGYRPLNWEPRIACKRGEAELAARRYGAGGGGSGPPRRGVATAGAVRQWLSYSGVALRSLSHSRTIVRASAPLWKSVATWRTKWMRRPPFERHAAATPHSRRQYAAAGAHCAAIAAAVAAVLLLLYAQLLLCSTIQRCHWHTLAPWTACFAIHAHGKYCLVLFRNWKMTML